MTQDITGNHEMHTLLTPKEVSSILKISYRKVLDLINNDELIASVIAGKFRVKQSDLEGYIDDNERTIKGS
jgi:excisionase family DNA binding protein